MSVQKTTACCSYKATISFDVYCENKLKAFKITPLLQFGMKRLKKGRRAVQRSRKLQTFQYFRPK